MAEPAPFYGFDFPIHEDELVHVMAELPTGRLIAAICVTCRRLGFIKLEDLEIQILQCHQAETGDQVCKATLQLLAKALRGVEAAMESGKM